MGKKNVETIPAITPDQYKKQLRELQIELVKVQRAVIENDIKVLIIFEGRDAAGKDGTIKRIIQYLSPRETRVVAMPKPSDRDRACWYFQRYVPHLPAQQEIVLFNRSWYNRAGVERVMGFCTDREYEEFMETVVPFEHMLVDSGIRLFKYYLDIDRDEQKRRLKSRRADPLKQWKVSSIDNKALKFWKSYSEARDVMFKRTHNPVTPWYVVRADDKRQARLNVIRHVLQQFSGLVPLKPHLHPDDAVLFEFNAANYESGMIAP